MNPFVAEVEVVVAVVVVEEVVAVEEVMAVVVMAVVVMEEVVTVTEDADTDADIMEEVMEEVGMAGEVGAGGPSMAGLIAEANPVLIIFSKSLNDPPFSQ
jgi:nanoRNase/pAp phosphatase (c-di-AMP/oligoRNAs hydrolase)